MVLVVIWSIGPKPQKATSADKKSIDTVLAYLEGGVPLADLQSTYEMRHTGGDTQSSTQLDTQLDESEAEAPPPSKLDVFGEINAFFASMVVDRATLIIPLYVIAFF